MFFFAERMKTLADAIRTSRKDRTEGIRALKEQTEHILAGAQSLLRNLDQQHMAMATQLGCTLAANRRTRQERVQAMQQDHRQHRSQACCCLQTLLSQARQTRHDHLQQLRTAWRQIRGELVGDFRLAAKTWRELCSFRKGNPT